MSTRPRQAARGSRLNNPSAWKTALQDYVSMATHFVFPNSHILFSEISNSTKQVSLNDLPLVIAFTSNVKSPILLSKSKDGKNRCRIPSRGRRENQGNLPSHILSWSRPWISGLYIASMRMSYFSCVSETLKRLNVESKSALDAHALTAPIKTCLFSIFWESFRQKTL